MSSQSASAPSAIISDSWTDIRRQALSLATALEAIARAQPPETQAACHTYAILVSEIAELASADGAVSPSRGQAPALTRKQLQDFGRLLRDKRNQAGFSRTDLARKAKLSDATIKFVETARHPPSRATLLRLVGVTELGLHWSETPGYFSGTLPTDAAGSPAATDSRLTGSVVLESLLVLDELRIGQHAIEVTAYGARRLCCLCGARSEAWTLDPREAVKLSLTHAPPCSGRLADTLWGRYPWLSELAHEERRSLRSLTATTIQDSLREIHRERFYGCRSGAELADLLARNTGLAPTAYRAGVFAVLLWAQALGPCPLGRPQKPFSEHRAHLLAQLLHKRGVARVGEASRLRGVVDAAAWLVEPQAPEPRLDPNLPQPPEASPP